MTPAKVPNQFAVQRIGRYASDFETPSAAEVSCVPSAASGNGTTN